MKNKALFIMLVITAIMTSLQAQADKTRNISSLTHNYANNNGVNIHYVAAGKGPLIVFIHGFPDFWYSWIDQIRGLKNHYRVVALDTRGYNRSDKPEGQDNYSLDILAQDVAAVIAAEGRQKATIVGHDWGGATAWYLAMTQPDLVSKLIVINFPHPLALSRELANNAEQFSMMAYAREFTEIDSHLSLTPKILAGIVTPDNEKYDVYFNAFSHSSINSMMNYYRKNYARIESGDFDQPMVTMPVLQIHGINDLALHEDGLNNTWKWVENDYTLLTLPGVGHWSHHEAPNLVTRTIRGWLKKHRHQ